MIVIDASVVLTWAYREEDLASAEAILLLVADKGAIAPAIWPMEVANSLEVSLR